MIKRENVRDIYNHNFIASNYVRRTDIQNTIMSVYFIGVTINKIIFLIVMCSITETHKYKTND